MLGSNSSNSGRSQTILICTHTPKTKQNNNIGSTLAIRVNGFEHMTFSSNNLLEDVGLEDVGRSTFPNN